jgi:hypothetical protein
MTESYVPTAEERAKHYSAALDSVNLINSAKPDEISQEEWSDDIERNVQHLELMVAKDFWIDEDMKPLRDAITAGRVIIK